MARLGLKRLDAKDVIEARDELCDKIHEQPLLANNSDGGLDDVHSEGQSNAPMSIGEDDAVVNLNGFGEFAEEQLGNALDSKLDLSAETAPTLVETDAVVEDGLVLDPAFFEDAQHVEEWSDSLPDSDFAHGLSSKGDLQEVARDLLVLWKEINKVTGEVEGEGGSNAGNDQESMVQKMTEDSKIEAVFPVYGAVKAGKSTFLSSIMREQILPAQSLPMTSIPIKITHQEGVSKVLHMKQSDKWNVCVHGFKQKLVAGVLPNEQKEGDENDGKWFEIQNRVSNGTVNFKPESHGDDEISAQLALLSHFVRLLWINEIDFEAEFEISLNVDMLPEVLLDMKAFRGGPSQNFSFLDTPGPNESGKAKQALKKIGPKVMGTSTGCIFCVPWNQCAASQQVDMYVHLNKYLAGKTVIVIVTHMDSFTGNDDEKTGIKGTILSAFNLNVRDKVKLHFTSGKTLLTMFELQKLTVELSSTPSRFVTELKNSGGLWKDLEVLVNISMAIGGRPDAQVLKYCKGVVNQQLEKANARAVLQDFNKLYLGAEHLAVQSKGQNLRGSLERLEQTLEKLKEYASASVEERKILEENLSKIEEVYTAVLAELDGFIDQLMTDINRLLEEKAFGPLKAWAASQDEWQIKLVDAETAEDLEDDEFEQALRLAGAKTGKITCSLSWHTEDDLDLHCQCPGGDRISWRKKLAGGGELDVDMNAGSHRATAPVENIFFPEPVAGTYKFSVNNFQNRTGGTTPYTVRLLRAGSETREFFPDITADQTVEAFSFEWSGSSGAGNGDGNPDRIPFPGGRAQMMDFLMSKGKPKFESFIKKQFTKIMKPIGTDLTTENPGLIKLLQACISEKWTKLSSLIDKLSALNAEDENAFLVFSTPPSWELNLAQILAQVNHFDVDAIAANAIEEDNQIVINNTRFRIDVLKGFDTAIDGAVEDIKEQLDATLQLVVERFETQVRTQKGIAENIKQVNAALLNESMSSELIEMTIDSVQPEVFPLKQRIKQMLEVGNQSAQATNTLQLSASSGGGSAAVAPKGVVATPTHLVELRVPLEELQSKEVVAKFPGVNPNKKEDYLSAEDFRKAFKMTRAQFDNEEQWKQQQLKKKANLLR